MRTIQVNLAGAGYVYQVKIGSKIIAECLEKSLAHYEQKTLYVVTNETVNALYPDFISSVLKKKFQIETLVLPDGEEHKNLQTLAGIYDFLAERKANRKSILIAFGGGVIGDMAGFAAATFMRGISYIQIPTTLLSQVDSGIGGKTGINHPSGKNFIGSFKQPLQTIIDVDMLGTLPEREFTAGYAELIKHGIIRDAYLFQLLNRNSLEKLRHNKDLLIEAVFRSCEVKAEVVEKDEKELNQRAILNFGHTFGHFLETYTNYTTFLHGEAVIVGMDFAAWWSFQHELIDKQDYQLIHDHLRQLGIHQKLQPVEKEDFINLIEHDKKSDSGGIRFIGLKSIGDARVFEKVTAESLWETLQTFMKTDPFVKFDLN